MQFTIFGDKLREGTYLLCIDLQAPVRVSFGRFRKGMEIPLDQGSYLYVGSALGAGKRAFPLAGRLLRHASRSGNRKPHVIRGELLRFFGDMGYDLKGKQNIKKLHWHIDYLLDLPEAEIAHIVMAMSPSRLESRLASLVASLPGVSCVVDRLGAQDAASGTHLFRVADTGDLLEHLGHCLPVILNEAQRNEGSSRIHFPE
jgi:Uri superfamily endonuclease